MKIRFLNILIISFLFLFGMCNTNTRLTENKKEIENEYIYPFDGEYFDLNKLEITVSETGFVDNFKTGSKYYQRFLMPDGINNFQKEIAFKGSKFKIKDDSSVEILFQDSTVKVIENKEAKINKDKIEENSFFLLSTDGVIHIKRLYGKYGYVMYKYDEKGHEIFNTHIKHTYMVIRGGNISYHPYLKYFTHTNEAIVFTSYERAYDKTHVISIKDGSLSTFSFKVTGIIRDVDENSIKGFIVHNEETGKVKVNFLTYDWLISKKQDVETINETLLCNNVVVVAAYSPITSGAALSAYNMQTGDVLWHADVKQLNAAHSKYSNFVILSLYKDRLIMEGIEASGKYLQIFDLKSGKRLFEKNNKE